MVSVLKSSVLFISYGNIPSLPTLFINQPRMTPNDRRSPQGCYSLDKVPLALLLGKNPLQLSTDLVTVYKENEIIVLFS